MSEEIASQSEESQEIERDADTEALYDSFGMTQAQPKKDVEFLKMDEPIDPAIDQEDEFKEEEIEEKQADTRKYKVKFNKEEVEVDESQVPDLLEKGMALDKTRAKLTEQQKAMDEIAQLQGYKDHAELLAKLPELRERQQQKEQNAHNELLTELRQQAEDAGLDPDQVENYLNNHPLIKEAQKTIQERETLRVEQEKQAKQQAFTSQWQELYTAFPDIIEDSKSFDKGENPSFFTEDMQAMVNNGYKPLDAYKLAHMDKITAQSKKSSQQQLIKQQQLGMRGHVNEQTATPPDEGSLLPVHYGLAEEFGVSLKGIQAQNKLIKNRR